MRRPAGLLLAVACILALAGSCSRHPPASLPVHTGGPFAASFSASASGDSGRLRFSGVLAAGPGGQLRVEIARGGESFLLVSGETGVSAFLSAGRLHLREGPGSRVVAEMLGIGITAPQISSLLMGDPGDLPPGCRLSAHRWRQADNGTVLATRLAIRCERERMKIKLSRLEALEVERAQRAFTPLPVAPGHRQVDAAGMARALLNALSGQQAGGDR